MFLFASRESVANKNHSKYPNEDMFSNLYLANAQTFRGFAIWAEGSPVSLLW